MHAFYARKVGPRAKLRSLKRRVSLCDSQFELPQAAMKEKNFDFRRSRALDGVLLTRYGVTYADGFGF